MTIKMCRVTVEASAGGHKCSSRSQRTTLDWREFKQLGTVYRPISSARFWQSSVLQSRDTTPSVHLIEALSTNRSHYQVWFSVSAGRPPPEDSNRKRYCRKNAAVYGARGSATSFGDELSRRRNNRPRHTSTFGWRVNYFPTRLLDFESSNPDVHFALGILQRPHTAPP